MVIDIRSM